MDNQENPGSTFNRKPISFCVTARNRLWQLEQTLIKNLARLGNAMEICIVDFGSSDGLSAWIWSNFSAQIDSGTLRFFEVKNTVYWNSPRAKNLAHRISTGNYLFNLDADNFISANDLKHIHRAAELNAPCWQYSNELPDGSYGRIGIPRELFFKLGGYDEGMLAMGGQDYDLMNRFTALDIKVLRLPPPEIAAIDNRIEQKIAEVNLVQNDAQVTYNLMNNFNVKRSRFRLDLEGAAIRGGFASFEGLLNGKPVLIDGFNNIHSITGNCPNDC